MSPRICHRTFCQIRASYFCAVENAFACGEHKHPAQKCCSLLAVGREEIESSKTPKGGWTKAQLAEWGIGWPPPKGWQEILEGGLL